MTTRKVRWALVGSGDLARKRLAAAIRSQPGSTLHSLVSRDPKARAPELQALAPEAVHARFEEMLEDESVDAVYLATPVFLHAPQAIAALEAGKDVLVEKPMALDLLQAREMCRVARVRSRRLAVAYYRRFWPRFQLVKEMLDRGELGELVLIRIALHSWYPGRGGEAGDWRVTPSKSGGGVLGDVGCHRLDLLAWWLGLPDKLVSRVMTLTHEYPAEDSVTALLEWEGGPAGTLSFNWNSRTWTDEIHLVGTRGQAHPPSVRRRDGDPYGGARRGAAPRAQPGKRARSRGGRLRPVRSGRPAAPFYRRGRSPGHSNHGRHLPIRPAGSLDRAGLNPWTHRRWNNSAPISSRSAGPSGTGYAGGRPIWSPWWPSGRKAIWFRV